MYQKYKELLTIGITAYNDEQFIKQTIESCVNQAGRIVICDNASTDNTGKICQELAKEYNNISYFRLDEDKGKCFGFNFVLKETNTKYFMWCGAHDFLDENYTTPMIHMLENSDAVSCFPASREITNDGEEIGIYDCWYANRLSSDSSCERIYTLIAHLHEVSGFYGVHRTDIIKKFLPQEVFTNMVGGDHPLLCALASEGRIIYSPRSIFNFRQTKANFSDEDNLKDYAKTIFKNSKSKKGFVASRKEMCEWQLKILKNCKVKNIPDFFRKIYLVKKAKKKLKKRFGF